MKKIEIVVFDLEGTLLRAPDFQRTQERTYWGIVTKRLGQEAIFENNRNLEKWKNGGYSGYSEFVLDTIRIHKKFGLNEHMLDEIVSGAEYIEGAIETIKTLQELNKKIAIISGGIKHFVDRVSVELGINHCFAAAEYFWNSSGGLHGWNVLPTDYEGKKQIVQMLLRDFGLTKEQCAFIGDGANDAHVPEVVGISIAFNPIGLQTNKFTHVISQQCGEENLYDSLRYIL